MTLQMIESYLKVVHTGISNKYVNFAKVLDDLGYRGDNLVVLGD